MANKVKVTFIQKKKLSVSIMEVFKKALDKQTLDDIGGQLVKLNQQYVRSGLDAKGNSFNPLSDKWIKRRKVLSKYNQTGPAYSHRKSNLTFTGQLIKAIQFFSKPSEGQVVIELNEQKRTKYILPSGKKSSGPRITNRKLGEHLASKGVVFIGLTQQMRDRANKILERKLRQLLRLLK